MATLAERTKEMVRELRPHAIWHVLLRIAEAFVFPVAYVILEKVKNASWDWWVAGGLFAISLLVMFRDAIFKKRPETQIQATEQNVALAPAQRADLDAGQFFRTAYYSQLTQQVENNMRAAAAQNQPNDREGFFARFVGVGYVAYLHDLTWAYIYRSQVLMLAELNRRGGIMPVADARAFYDAAVVAYPHVYTTYSFDGWLGFVQHEQLIILHPSNMIEITIRGRDFLTYLAHWGRTANDRRG